jgi:hypothetical protein
MSCLLAEPQSCSLCLRCSLHNCCGVHLLLLVQVNQMLPIGGPGGALTARAQAEMLFRITGQKENMLSVPVALMDGVIGILDFLAKFFPKQFEVNGGCCCSCWWWWMSCESTDSCTYL